MQSTATLSHSRLPHALATAVRDKSLLIFAGAGVSMLPPSSLPDWVQFNEALLAEAKRAALTACALDHTVSEAIARLQLEEIGMQTFSEAIVKIISGDGYFPVLQALDGEQPNANHLAIAQLVKLGIVRAVVTTNFDTLLERAFSHIGDPVRVALTAEEYRAQGNDACTLYKIHGSVTDASTLVDTVGQKMRGLPPYMRTRLAKLFRQYHVLVIGYSGKDLEFGSDYLSFSSLDATGPGITWLTQPRKQAGEPPRIGGGVAAILERAKPQGELVEGTLPEFLELLGATFAQPAAVGEAEASAIAFDRVLSRTRALFNGLGGRNALAFCMRLLADVGRVDQARAVRAALVADIEAAGDELPDNDSPALRALVVTAPLLEGEDSQERWLRRELRHYERREASWQSTMAAVTRKIEEEGLGPSAGLPLAYPFPGRYDAAGFADVNRRVVSELHRLQAGAWSNLALFLARQGEPEAIKALERSLDFCELSAARVELAHMYFAYGYWSRLFRADPDECLAWLAVSEAAGISAGNLDAANAAALVRAEALVCIGEYSSALACLDRARRRLPLTPNRELEDRIGQLTAKVQRRRSSGESTQQEILDAVGHSVDPENQFELDVRCALVDAENAGDVGRALACLRELSHEAYRSGRFVRALELAEAHLEDATRAGDFIEQMRARWLLGNARYAVGDAEGARAVLESLQGIEMAEDPTFAGRLEQLLARIAAGDVPQQSSSVMIMRLIAGEGLEPRAACAIEDAARDALERHELGPARIWLLEAIDAHGIEGDLDGLERCYGLLADAAMREGRQRHAEALRRIAAGVREPGGTDQ